MVCQAYNRIADALEMFKDAACEGGLKSRSYRVEPASG
jgi:hypothetical protein